MRNRIEIPLLVVLLILVLFACGKPSASPNTDDDMLEAESSTVADESGAATDYQYNLAGDMDAINMMQDEENLYLFHRGYLYFADSNGMMVPLCTKSNCMHNSETCDAWLNAMDNCFCADGALYAMGLSDDMMSFSLKQYSMQGQYVKDVVELPFSLQKIIQHRGVLYYTYYQEAEDLAEDERGIPTLACRPMGKGKETILYQGEDYSGILGDLYAYGNQVYVRSDSSAGYSYLIYHIQAKELTALENVGEMMVYQNRLIFTYEEGARKDLYSAALDGTDIQSMEWTLKNEVGLFAVFGDIVVEDNLIEYNQISMENGTFRQVFTVYKNGNHLFDFSLDDIDGKDYSKMVCLSFRVTEDSVYCVAISDGLVRHRNLLRLDREAFERGEIQAEVVYTLD